MALNVENAQGVTYLFGHPIAHSWSPLLHNTLYKQGGLPWTYELFESTDVQAFLGLLRDPRCMGSSVTMPHKVAITGYLDELTTEGREVGACNTIFVREHQGQRRYIGTNTDVVGIREAFAQNIENVYDITAGKPGLVIGGGGAARSAVYTMNKWMKCSQIYMVNRDKAEVDAVIESCKKSGFGDNIIHVSTAEQARALPGPAMAVGCVPDFPPVTAAEREARKVVEVMFQEKPEKGIILEMAYHPTVWTELAKLAEQSQWQVVLGVEAVIWQGIAQHMLWTGKSIEDIPVKACKEVFAAALSSVRSNL